MTYSIVSEGVSIQCQETVSSWYVCLCPCMTGHLSLSLSPRSSFSLSPYFFLSFSPSFSLLSLAPLSLPSPPLFLSFRGFKDDSTAIRDLSMGSEELGEERGWGEDGGEWPRFWPTGSWLCGWDHEGFWQTAQDDVFSIWRLWVFSFILCPSLMFLFSSCSQWGCLGYQRHWVYRPLYLLQVLNTRRGWTSLLTWWLKTMSRTMWKTEKCESLNVFDTSL